MSQDTHGRPDASAPNDHELDDRELESVAGGARQPTPSPIDQIPTSPPPTIPDYPLPL